MTRTVWFKPDAGRGFHVRRRKKGYTSPGLDPGDRQNNVGSLKLMLIVSVRLVPIEEALALGAILSSNIFIYCIPGHRARCGEFVVLIGSVV